MREHPKMKISLKVRLKMCLFVLYKTCAGVNIGPMCQTFKKVQKIATKLIKEPSSSLESYTTIREVRSSNLGSANYLTINMEKFCAKNLRKKVGRSLDGYLSLSVSEAVLTVP